MLPVQAVLVGGHGEQEGGLALLAVVLQHAQVVGDVAQLALAQGRAVLVIVQRTGVVQPPVGARHHGVGRGHAEQPRVQMSARINHGHPVGEVVGEVVAHLGQHVGIQARLLIEERRPRGQLAILHRLFGRGPRHAHERKQQHREHEHRKHRAHRRRRVQALRDVVVGSRRLRHLRHLLEPEVNERTVGTAGQRDQA